MADIKKSPASKALANKKEKFLGATAYMGKGKYRSLSEKQYDVYKKTGTGPKGAHYVQKVSQ